MGKWLSSSFLIGLAGLAGGAAQDVPAPPDRAAARMKLPDGFKATLFAGEPDVVKPIAMTTDERGRLWVVESHSYPHWLPPGKEGRDRVLVFEDRKGTGRYDSVQVFWDRGTNLSGIAIGFGGVWLCATPYLLFVPYQPGQDKPSGPPVVVLDGWDLGARHNVFNGLTWGPDGWLYGLNGILSNSRVGPPGTPDDRRTALNCGVWRYHPARKTFEVVAHGTTNPWGLDFDDYGAMFITNCVIKHLFHVVPGAHYERMYGSDLNPNAYGLMAGCADHLHWAGGPWTGSRGGQGAHDEAGGGHAHAGALIYLGDNWPDSYRNHVFMCNIHGNRVNQDLLERKGSGYVARHGPDFLLANDPWFRGLSLAQGPDGGVYVSDWCDTGECHNYDKITATTGRVFKVVYGRPTPVAVDLARQSDEQLVRLQLHKNDWWVRQSRRLLQERAGAGTLDPSVRKQLLSLLAGQTEVPRRLRVLWALFVTGGLDDQTLTGLLDDRADAVRAWAVRLLLDAGPGTEALAARLAEMARTEVTAPVRLALASALQRLPPARRWPLAEALATRIEDAGEPNLPLMIWYGLEPLVPLDPGRAGRLLARVRIPLVRQYLARRLATWSDKGLEPLVRYLVATDDPETRRDVLRGLYEALRGRRLGIPAGWADVQRCVAHDQDAEVRDKVLLLSVLFGDVASLEALRQTVRAGAADTATRQRALQTLVEARAPDLPPLLRELVAGEGMRGPALRALAAFEDPETPEFLLRHYPSFTESEKADAVATLASRPSYALALVEALERGRVPRADVSAFTVRQLLAFKEPRLAAQVARVWGSARATSADKAALLSRYLALVPPDALARADRGHGRLVFARTCASCHVLFGEGKKIGPDLTGSQRANPEYVLSKVLDPSAVVARDYQVTVLTTVQGRTLTGLVVEENDKVLTLQTPTELVRVPKADVEERRRSPQSLMPEGQLTPLSDAEVRDLIAYLAGPGQVSLPDK